MKILYCGIASKFIHTMPAGWFLCEYLKGKGIPAKEMYRNVNEPLLDVLEEIKGFYPDYLLLSVYIFNVTFIRNLIAEVRNHLPECIIIVGGPEADDTIDANNIVIGEGEETLYALLTKGGDKIISATPICNLDDLPSPYTKERLAASKHKMVYYESSRGCPFSCSYCMAGLTDGVRYFSLNRVKQDIINIVNSNAKIIKFTDRTFNANAVRTNEILKFVLDTFKDNREICFHFEVGADLFNDSTLSLLSKMPEGLVQLEAGIQTLNRESLKAINRPYNSSKLIKNINRIMACGNIHLHLDLIAGLPHETLESFRKGFDAIYALKPHKLQLGFLKFLKGTPIRKDTVAEYKVQPPYEVIATPTLSAIEISEIKRVEAVFDRLYNSGRFLYTMEYLLSTEDSAYNLYLSLADHILPLKDNGDYSFQKYLLTYKGGLPYIKEVLRLDYCCTNAVNKTPSILKKDYSKEFRDYLRTAKKDPYYSCEEFEYLPDKGKGSFVVKFNYYHKNRVNGRYNYEIIGG